MSSAGQVKHSDKFYMLIATGARMALSLATFVVVVRYLGPANFGFYAACLAVASVAAAVTDFGLATSSMRSASMDRDQSKAIIGDAFALKLCFALLALLMCGGAGLLIVQGDEWLTFLLLLAGMLAYSAGDLLLVAARVERVFAREARIVVVTGLAMFVAVGATAAMTGSLLWVATAFAVTRVLYLAWVWLGIRDLLQPLRHATRSVGKLFRTAKDAADYAVDSVLTMVSGQIDVLVFATLLTLAELGTYQAGARLTQIIVPFAVMLSSVYLPALSASLSNAHPDEEFRTLSGRLSVEFGILAVVGALLFYFGGPIVTNYIYGPEFAALNQLWPAFAVYALLRFAAAGFGIQLVALGMIRSRITSNMISLFVFLIVAFTWIPQTGFASSAWVMATMGLSSFLVLGIAIARADKAHPVTRLSVPGLLIVACGFYLLA